MTNDVNQDLPKIDLSSLERASRQLEIALTTWATSPGYALIRAAVIQHFEFTYELSIKMLRRYLRLIAASETEVNELTFRDLIRRAGDFRSVQSDLLTWLEYRQARTDTVYTYNEGRAVEAAETARNFAGDARMLLDRLKERLQA